MMVTPSTFVLLMRHPSALRCLLLLVRLGPHPQALLARRLRASLGPQALFFLLPSSFFLAYAMPPGKNTRSTNQNAPATMTITDPATARRRPAISLLARTAASSDATARTTSSCPISTPTLNENNDQP